MEGLEQKVRAAEEQLASTSAFLKAIQVRLRRRSQGFYEERAPSGLEEKGVGGYLSLEQAVVRRRWGAKKRDYRAMTAALPSKKALQDEWTKL